MTRVHRRDFAGTVSAVTRTPQGGLRLDAAVTRVGVLDYRDHAGKAWREWKPAEEVFRADSLETLIPAPATELHPSTMVDGDTWADVTVGHPVGAPRRDGGLVVVPLAIQRAGTVAKVDAGELHDVSAGYTCRVDWTAGVTPEGEHYDAIQRDIRYNHIALGPRGWGRAGEEVSLRLDGAAEHVRGDAPAKGQSMKKIKVRGREFKLDADEEVVQAQGAVDTLAAALDAAESALKTAIGEVAALRAKTEAEEKAEPPKVTEDMVPDEVADALAAKREVLRADARTVLGADAKIDGLKPRKIHEMVIAKALPETKLDGLTDATVHGMFVAAVAGAKKAARVDALGAIGGGTAGTAGTTTHTDSADDVDGALSPAAALNARSSRRFDTRNTSSEAR